MTDSNRLSPSRRSEPSACNCNGKIPTFARTAPNRDMERAIIIIAASMVLAGLGIGFVIGYAIRAAMS